MTDTEFNAWLNDPTSQKEIIVEMEHAGGVVRVCRQGIATRPTDQHPNQIIPGLLTSTIQIESGFNSRLSFGGLEIVNTGELDSWLDFKWYGYPVVILLGDKSWLTDDFRRVGVATNGGITDASASQISFSLLDGSALFDQPILSATASNGELIPRAFGKTFAVTPVLTDHQTLEYQVSGGAVDSVVVMDNGAVVNHTADYENGKFTLNSSPIGTLTADVTVNASLTAQNILTQAANAVGMPVDGSALAALPAYELGIFVNTNATWSALLDDVCTSLGAFWWVNEVGELTAAQFKEPSMVADAEIIETHIREGMITPILIEQPAFEIQLKYGRRWTQLSTLAGALDDETRDRLARQWDTQIYSNNLIGFRNAQPFELETALANSADALAEVQRLGSLKGHLRQQWRINTTIAGAELQPGQTLKITHPRFGFSSGKNALITRVSKSLVLSDIEIEVWL